MMKPRLRNYFNKRPPEPRILCVNCNICLNVLNILGPRYRVLELDSKMCTVFCNWVHPVLITEEDYVCEACHKLAMAAVCETIKQENRIVETHTEEVTVGYLDALERPNDGCDLTEPSNIDQVDPTAPSSYAYDVPMELCIDYVGPVAKRPTSPYNKGHVDQLAPFVDQIAPSVDQIAPSVDPTALIIKNHVNKAPSKDQVDPLIPSVDPLEPCVGYLNTLSDPSRQDYVKALAGPSNVGNVDPLAGRSIKGHASVCLLCGCSLLQKRRKSDLIIRKNQTELHLAVRKMFEERIAPRKLSPTDKACHACWLKSRRAAQRMISAETSKTLNDPESLLTETKENETNFTPEALNTPQPAPNTPESAPDLPRSAPDLPQSAPDLPRYAPDLPQSAPNTPNEMILSKYRRAANTGSRCVFPNCTSTRLHVISDQLRATVISNHKFYLPILSRICDSHLLSNNWGVLFDSTNSIRTFTVDQIEHVFSFVNAFNQPVDFNNIRDMDDRIFEYWVGISKLEFYNMLKKEPRFKGMKRASLGLAAHLVKLKTNDSNDRLSRLFQVPRSTLERIMHNVQKVLAGEGKNCQNS